MYASVCLLLACCRDGEDQNDDGVGRGDETFDSLISQYSSLKADLVVIMVTMVVKAMAMLSVMALVSLSLFEHVSCNDDGARSNSGRHRGGVCKCLSHPYCFCDCYTSSSSSCCCCSCSCSSREPSPSVDRLMPDPWKRTSQLPCQCKTSSPERWSSKRKTLNPKPSAPNGWL